MTGVVVVGDGAAGLGTAESLRRLGYEGAITLVGDEPGPPYDRPPLSKQLLAGQWDPARVELRDAATVTALGLDLRSGVSATGVDLDRRTVQLADADPLHYDALVVATGVRARVPASGRDGVHVLRTLTDALALRDRLRPGRRLVIVGAGFVGAEVAAVARGLGVEVSLLETAAVPLASAVGVEVGTYVTALHRQHGVDLRTGAAVTEIAAHEVHLADGSVLDADDVLVAIGSVANTDWLSGSGLTVDDGLVCDQYCAAADGVYGVGDVARWYNPLYGALMRIEHRTNASEQALHVARTILDPSTRVPFAPVPYVWSDQYDARLQAYGYLRDHEEALVLDRGHQQLLVAYRRGDRLVGVLGIGQTPKTLRRYRNLLTTRPGWDAATSLWAASG